MVFHIAGSSPFSSPLHLRKSCQLDLAVAEMGCLHWLKIPISVAVMSSHVTLDAVISGEGWPLVI